VQKIRAIAYVTAVEAIRGRALYSLVFFVMAMMVGSTLFGSVSLGDQILIMKDFGLFAISFSSIIFTIILGANFLSKEINRKTIFNIVSKPVLASEFILGKFLGLYLTGALLLVLMILALASYLSFFEGSFDPNLLVAGLFMLLELALIAGLVIFFSSIVITPVLNGLFTLGVFIAGRSVESLLQLKQSSGSMVPEVLYFLLPHLNRLTVSDQLVYGIRPSIEQLAWAALYSVTYTFILLFLSVVFFRLRRLG
jgi:ABC-type transport system involved in multi-copper enzyme maturation permease subunit